jgi:hypothetical protein
MMRRQAFPRRHQADADVAERAIVAMFGRQDRADRVDQPPCSGQLRLEPPFAGGAEQGDVARGVGVEPEP